LGIHSLLKKGPDPSPNEFPIFNVSHNPAAPYPNPINHLYDKRYKEAYSTFIKQNQPTSSSSQKAELPTSALPTPPSPSKPTINSNSPSYPTYPQGQYQQKSNNQQAPPPAGFLPGFRQQSSDGWQYINPYAAMPPSNTAYYQQPSQGQPLRNSSTGEDLRSNSLSRSASNNDLNYSTNSGKEKIRVRVINDGPTSASADSQMTALPNNHLNSPRSILKSNSDINNNKETLTARTIYASPNTEIDKETMEDLLKVVQNQRSGATRSTAAPMTERVIIIDRRGSSPPDNNPNSSGQDRFRTFEIRTTTSGVTPSVIATTSTPTSPSTTTTSSVVQGMQQPTYYTGQQLFYQQPKIYSSVPNNLYSTVTPYVQNVNAFYPFGYYYY
jgi:hypothetical protein